MNSINNYLPLSAQQQIISPRESLGKGEQGEVFLVEVRPGERFALKCFFTKEEKGDDFAVLFDRDGTPFSALSEWEVGQHLRHPNLIQIHELKRGSKTTLLEEYVEGRTVNQIELASLSKETTLRLIRQLVDVLAYAFTQGWVHLDLFSENMMVDSEGNLKLIDLDGFSRIETNDELTVEEIQRNVLFGCQCLLHKGMLSRDEQREMEAILEDSFSNFFKENREDIFSDEAVPPFVEALRLIEHRLSQ